MTRPRASSWTPRWPHEDRTASTHETGMQAPAEPAIPRPGASARGPAPDESVPSSLAAGLSHANPRHSARGRDRPRNGRHSAGRLRASAPGFPAPDLLPAPRDSSSLSARTPAPGPDVRTRPGAGAHRPLQRNASRARLGRASSPRSFWLPVAPGRALNARALAGPAPGDTR